MSKSPLLNGLGVEERGGYYDESGALRDMVQNHTLQLAVTAWPWTNQLPSPRKTIRAEKVKVFEQLVQPNRRGIKEILYPWSIPFWNDSKGKKTSLIAVSPMSTLNLLTETFASGAFFVDSDRFRGVPFFFRTGKRLTQKGTMVNVVFKQTDSIFGHELATKCFDHLYPTK